MWLSPISPSISAFGVSAATESTATTASAPERMSSSAISSAGCILDLGLEHSIVTKSGSFFSYGDERLGQGRNNAKGFLDEHPDRAKEIEDKIYEALGIERDGVKPIAAVEPVEEVEQAA